MACERCKGTSIEVSCSLGACLADEIEALKAMPDEEIDTSDFAEDLDWSKAERGRFFKPPADA